MAQITLAVGNPADTEPSYELTQWGNVSLTRHVRSGSSLGVDGITAHYPLLQKFTPMAMDLWLYVGSALRFRGRVVPGDRDEVGPAAHPVSLQAVDYRRLLEAKVLRNLADGVGTFTNDDQSDIAWALVNHAQTPTNGTLHITRGADPAGTPRDRLEWKIGDSIGQLIDSLQDVEGGIEYEVTPERVFNVYTLRKTRVTGLEIVHPDTASAVSVAPAPFANVVVATGAEGLTYGVTTPDLSTDPRGRWEATVAFPNVSDVATLAEHANFAIAELAFPRLTFDCAMAPPLVEAHAAAPILPGDLCTVTVVSGWLAVTLLPCRVLGTEEGYTAKGGATLNVVALEELDES